jgi:hypothetical protein
MEQGVQLRRPLMRSEVVWLAMPGALLFKANPASTGCPWEVDELDGVIAVLGVLDELRTIGPTERTLLRQMISATCLPTFSLIRWARPRLVAGPTTAFSRMASAVTISGWR